MQNVVNLVNQNEGLRKQNLSLQQENAHLRLVLKLIYGHVGLSLDPEKTDTEESFGHLYIVQKIIKDVLGEEVCK